MNVKQQARGSDGLRIVTAAEPRADLIAATGVTSEMLLASESLFLKRELIAPGAQGVRHYHGTASIIVMLEGCVTVNYGDRFQYVDTLSEGEFLLIPALMPHQPVNDGPQSAKCLVVRNAPWDDIILYKDASLD